MLHVVVFAVIVIDSINGSLPFVITDSRPELPLEVRTFFYFLLSVEGDDLLEDPVWRFRIVYSRIILGAVD